MAKAKSKLKKVPLNNEDHEDLAKSLQYISNNIAIMRTTIEARKTHRGVASGVTAVESAARRLKEKLLADWQEQNRPEGPYI